MSMERLNKIRAKITEVEVEKAGQQRDLEIHQERMKEIEETCMKDFSTPVEELPEVIKNLEKEYEDKLIEAEKELGLI